ncbi:MAG: hypothetical protein WCE80_13565 [Acidimicrobiia bacterium]
MRRPLTGAILGFLLGLAIAVMFQQQGLYPLDQVSVFLIPGILGVIGMLLLSIGREGGTVAYVIALILLIPALVWGALGVGDTNQKGQLNGGCLVAATSSAPDQTRVTDSYKRDPFKIDPQGSLHWEAASPTIFMDYDWEMWVEIGGIAVPFDSGHELNDGGSPANQGDVGNVAAYAQSVGVNLDQLRGVFMVGGFAATCDGFGFVVLTTDGFTTPSIVAAILAILILIILIILMFRGRGSAGVGSTAVVDGGPGEPGPAADIAAGAIVSGYATPEATEGPPPELSDDDVDDIQEALDESFPEDTNLGDDESPSGRHEDGGGA